MAEIPDIEAFGISRTRGFLSDDRPLASFNDTYYAKWDEIIARLPDLLCSHELASEIHRLPVLETTKLSSEVDFRRAYVVLGFLIQGLIWGDTAGDKAVESVPPQLSEPFLAVCQHLGMEPILSYAGASLWNWTVEGCYPASSEVHSRDISQLYSLASFTGTFDECAFCLVPVLIEAEGGHLVQLLLNAVAACDKDNASFVINALNHTADALLRMRGHLSKLFSMVDVDTYYQDIRPFFSGSKNMEHKGLPNGAVFQNRDGTQLFVRCIGANAGQSALFQFLDIVLGIKHEDTENCKDVIFQEMRGCMPRKHREFLLRAAELASIRSFVELNVSNQALALAYDNCIDKMRSWRGRHIAVASKYIVQPGRLSKDARDRSKQQLVEEPTIDRSGDVAAKSSRGTGGTSVIPFLQQLRDETVGVKGPL